MLFVTIKRVVCISLLVNTKTLFMLFKTVTHHNRAAKLTTYGPVCPRYVFY